MGKHNQNLGEFGEETALKYLRRNDFIIIKKNYRAYWGEIDIIAEKEETLHFIEVKTRKNTLYGPPELAVTYKKRQAIRKCALSFLKYDGQRHESYCFDVITILILPNYQIQLKFIENAFC